MKIKRTTIFLLSFLTTIIFLFYGEISTGRSERITSNSQTISIPNKAGATSGSTIINAIWTTVPNSRLDAIKYDWSPNPTPGTFSGIFAWSGGALDTKRDRLLIFGGGHGDYGGQEIYAFDFSTLEWSRVSEPEDYNALDLDCIYGGRTDNNLPKSSHTYDRLAYIESIDSLCDTRGAVGFRECKSAVEMACYSFTTNKWSYLEESVIEPVGGAGAFSALHPITKDWWVHGAGGSINGRLAKYNVTTKQWSIIGRYDNILGDTYFKVAEIDPNRNLLIVGKGKGDKRGLYALPLDGFQAGSSKIKDYPVATTGMGPLDKNLGVMGFAYDPVSQKMVAWEGGSQVYILDTGTWKWTIIPGTGDAPGDPNKTGTYGRFVYIESLDRFALVNGPSENVYLLDLRDESSNNASVPTSVVVSDNGETTSSPY